MALKNRSNQFRSVQINSKQFGPVQRTVQRSLIGTASNNLIQYARIVNASWNNSPQINLVRIEQP